MKLWILEGSYILSYGSLQCFNDFSLTTVTTDKELHMQNYCTANRSLDLLVVHEHP